jgi:signal transduction histidine kinase
MQTSILLIYFIYGLAFYSMGLALLLETRRSRLLTEARVLRPLAFFGFLHGSHEWLEMMLLARAGLALPTPALAPIARLGLLVVSFILLLMFGLRALQLEKKRLTVRLITPGLILICLFLSLVFFVGLFHGSDSSSWVDDADVLARYLLAVPGAGLAALGLSRQARLARSLELHELNQPLRFAAWGFALYSLTQLVVSPQDLFLARALNTRVFLEAAGFPIQVVRAALAVGITVSLLRLVQAAEIERQRELLAAQKARLEALEQLQIELAEREQLRRELLRHTVIAQEDERKRIARELHDETAQFLTALRLNLATLETALPKKTEISRLIERLQQLSREMSQGIYRMVHDLRPAQLDDLGLAAALQHLVDEAQRQSGLVVLLEISGSRQRLDALVETVLFRIAQEGLSNVARHSGCDHALLQLCFTPDMVKLTVIDQGIGFDVNQQRSPPHGWGLAGMRERADSAGGQFSLESTPGKGTRMEVRIPLTPPEQPVV